MTCLDELISEGSKVNIDQLIKGFIEIFKEIAKRHGALVYAEEIWTVLVHLEFVNISHITVLKRLNIVFVIKVTLEPISTAIKINKLE